MTNHVARYPIAPESLQHLLTVGWAGRCISGVPATAEWRGVYVEDGRTICLLFEDEGFPEVGEGELIPARYCTFERIEP